MRHHRGRWGRLLNLAASGTRGHRRLAGLFVRGFGDSADVRRTLTFPALMRRDRTGAPSATGRFR
jgi:hypothetical protein